MDIETQSIMALNTFKSNLINKREYGNDGFQFDGLVTYVAHGKTATEILEITLIIGGYEPCIQLDNQSTGKIITSEKFHMDFNPKFFKNTWFNFDPTDNSITITGKNSPKLGNYTVTIIEV